MGFDPLPPQALWLGTLISVLFVGGCIIVYQVFIQKKYKDQQKDQGWLFFCLLLFGLFVRLIIAFFVHGYETDMACWMSWSEATRNHGIFALYTADMFIDYPPGYMFFLYIISWIREGLNIPVGSHMHGVIIKLFPMLADLLVTWGIYRLICLHGKKSMALGVALVYLFNPAVIVNSAAWGQIDGLFVVFVLFYCYALYRNKIVVASAWFAVGLLIKPQMLFFGPVLMVAYFLYVKKVSWKEALKTLTKGFGLAVGIFLLIVAPFAYHMGIKWIFDLYFSTIGSYAYINLNAFNLYMLLGLNWVPLDETRWGLPLAFWSYTGFGISLIVYTILQFLKEKKEFLFLGAATLTTGIFILAPKMHERYLFPAIALLLVAYIIQKDIKLFWLFVLISVSQFMNSLFVLYQIHLPADDVWIGFFSLLTVVAYILLLKIFAQKHLKKSS